MRTLLLFFWLGSIAAARAQYRINFVLKTYPGQHRSEAIYLAGSFNQWNPAAATAQFSNGDDQRMVMLTVPAGHYEYKLTRGGWDRVECLAGGKDMGNRVLQLSSDTLIYIDITAWKDDFTNIPMGTATANVHIIDTAFVMPDLGNRKRRIWAYLPPDYATGNKRYPVLYMHDGQNLFDERTAPFGEWGVDECLDSLQRMNRPACIVVGIDHGGNTRMTEYNPYSFDRFGEGEGDRYVDFLVHTLKPFIDGRYRTIAGQEGTFIAGSSMGGLISCYAVLRYPKVFGGAGIFSPAFWTAPALDAYIDSLKDNIKTRFFFYAGGQESDRMVPDMERIAGKIALKADNMMYSVVDAEGKHNEPAWRKWLPVFYDWLFFNSAR